MILFANYLLKVIACSGIFFLYYHLALRNKAFHQWNRFYLLITVLLSLALPLCKFTIYQTGGASPGSSIHLIDVVGSANDYLEEVIITNQKPVNRIDYPGIAYVMVSSICFLFLLRTFLTIRKIIRNHPVHDLGDIRFVNTEISGTPFTFFRYIFWNKDISLESNPGRQIFEHELVHVKEKHSVDKVFLQCILIFFWCNPFFWLIRRELRAIHEFIADQRAIAQNGPESFAAMVLQSVYPTQFNSLTSPFFQTSIKRRFQMLSRVHNLRMNYLSRIAVLPILAMVILAFTIKTKTLFARYDGKPITVIVDAGHGTVNGKPSGAQNNALNEDEIVLSLAKKIKELNNSSSIKIILTRNGHEAIGLTDRVNIAAERKGDLFISLHINADVTESDKHGLEILVPEEKSPYNERSKIFASVISRELSPFYPSPTLELRRVASYVLNNNVCPAILMECGYLTNMQDRQFISNEKNQDAVALKILSAIQQYASQEETRFTGQVIRDSVPGKLKESSRLKDNPVQPGNVPKNDREGLGGEQQRSQGGKISITTTSSEAAPKTEVPVIVDGKTIYKNWKEVPLKPEQIKEIKVIKGEYINKALGVTSKEGIIIIISKESTPEAQNEPVFTQAEKEAWVDKEVWRKFLETNLQSVIEEVSIQGAKPGQYTAQIRFIVQKDGKLSDFSIVKDPGYGLGEKVMDLIRMGSPLWHPAEQNGKLVNSYHTQPVTFVISDETEEKTGENTNSNDQ